MVISMPMEANPSMISTDFSTLNRNRKLFAFPFPQNKIGLHALGVLAADPKTKFGVLSVPLRMASLSFSRYGQPAEGLRRKRSIISDRVIPRWWRFFERYPGLPAST